MYIRFGAQFPDPGIGLVVGFPRALTDRLERFEIGRSRDAQQPLVEERLHIGKHDLAIGVVPAETLMDTARELAARIAANPGNALRLTKRDRKSTRLKSSHYCATSMP